jgi:acyl transferase domain-containing protein
MTTNTNALIAIIGIGARLRGGANYQNKFWQLLLQGFNGISTTPALRWDTSYFHDPDNEGLVGKSIQDKSG